MLTTRIDHSFAAEDLLAVAGAENVLETTFAFCVSLTPKERHDMYKLGGKSESFVHRILDLASLNPDLVPGRISTTHMARNIQTWQTLRQHHARVQQLVERMDHSVMLLGMDIIQDALGLYRSLQAHGKAAGIEELLADIGQRFSRRKATETEPTEGAEAPGSGETTTP